MTSAQFQRHLFNIKHRGKTLGFAIKGRGHRRTYIGYIDGELAALAPAKGQLLRDLMQIANQPRQNVDPSTVRAS
jgi:hypothetical protein